MAELEWVAGKVGSWFTAADWSPEEVPTASDEVIIDGTSSLAEIDDATGVANTVTIDADDELEVGTGGVLDATNTINVDGVGAELLVTNGGKVESFNFNVLDIGGTTPNSAGEGELTLAGTGAAIEPATVELNGGSSALDFEMTVAEYTFSNNITGLGHVVEVGPGNVILTGDNTYSGGTFIEDATLQIGNGGATGSIGSGKVIDDGTLAFDQLGSHVIANAISGPGGVSFSGGGVFALTGDDSYSGVTTIAAGTKLTFAFLGTGGIVDNGSLSFEFSGAVSLTNNISGSGEVFQNGSTLTLTGDNTYTGATTVESGTLKAGASDAFSAASAFDVFSGSTLDLNGFNNTIGGLSGAGTVNNSSSADKAGLGVGESVNSTFSGVIENTGAALTLLVAGAGTLTLTGANTYTGDTIIVNGCTLQIGNGGTTGTLGRGEVVDSGTLVFDYDQSVKELISQDISDGKLGPGSLTVEGGGAVVLLGDNTYSGVTTISSGDLIVGQSLQPSGTLGTGKVVDNDILSFARPDTTTVTNAISGTGQVFQAFGTTIFTGDNTYSGATTVGTGTSSGTLQAGALDSLSANSAVTVDDNATLDLIGFSNVIGGLSGAGTVNNSSDAGSAVLTVDENVDSTFSGVIENTGDALTLIVGGVGALTLTGANTYAGATGIASGGTLQIGNGGTTGTLGSGEVEDSGRLVFDRSNNETVSQDISDAGSLTIEGGGVVTLSGSNTYTGATTVESGALKAGDHNAFGVNSAVTVDSGATLDFNGFTNVIGALSGAGTVNNSSAANIVALSIDEEVNSVFSGVIENTGDNLVLTVSGVGALTLTGANTYTGGSGIAKGATLQIGNGGTTGTLGSGGVEDSGTLVFDRSNSEAISQVISDSAFGAGAATFEGGGVFTLLGDNTYSGVTTISSGQLQVGEDGTTGTLGTGAVHDNGALAFAREGEITVANAISGTGQVEQFFGATILTGNNSYGSTRIEDGVLQVGDGGTTGTLGTGAVVDDDALEFDLAGANVVANSISGTGGVTQLDGDIKFTGSNNYQGSTTIASGATLSVGGGGTTGTLGTGAVFDSGSLVFARSNAMTVANAISKTGSVTALSGTTILTGANTYSGATVVNGGAVLEVLNASATSAVSVLGSGNVVVDAGAVLLFDNADTIDNGYVVNNVISGEGEVNFAGANDAVTTLNVANSFDGAHIFSGIVDLSNNASLGAGPVAMTGGAIRADNGAKTIANKFTLSGTIGLGAATNISGAITLAGATVVTPSENAGASTWSGAVSLGAFTLATGNTGPNTHNGSWSGQALTISGAISGTAGVTQDSSGELILSGANTYSGPTTVTSGKLEVLNSSTTSAVGGLGGGQVNVATGAALLFDNADTVDNGYVVNNAILGGGAVDFVGPNDGVTTLNVANSFTGGANIASGIVDLSNNASLGADPVAMTGGAIRADHGAKTLANKFTLSGTIGLGAATSISGAITLAGNTIVTPSENAGNSTWSGPVSLGAFTLATGNTGPNTHGGSWSGQALTISGAISETGGVTQASSGELILSGRNTYSGPTTVASGALEVLNASTTSAIGVLGSGNVVVDAGAVLLFDNADTIDNGYVVNNLISGEGEVNFAGANGGVTTLNVANSFDGAHIFSGIVDLSNNASLGVGPVTMTGGAIRADHGAKTLANKFTLSGTIGLGAATSISGAITLAGNTIVTPSENAGNSTWSGAISLGAFTLATGDTGPNTHSGSWSGQALTISGAISGTGGITQGSSGTLILSGGNTYSGPTTVASGTLEVLNASTTTAVGVLGSGSVVIDSGATVLFANHDTVNDGYLVKNSISGAGSLVFAGQTDSVTTMFNNEPLFTGSTTISNGIVNVWENDDVFGSGEVTMTGGALRATELPATIANNFRLSGTIGLGGSTNISGAITLAGNTTVTPSENAGDSTWSGAVSLGGFTLATGDSGPNSDGGSWSGQALTISGAISGTGGVTQDSLGELDLTGRNSYSGATTIEEGALAIGNAQALGSGGLRFSGSGALDADFTGTVTTATTVNAGVAASITAGAGDSFTLSGALTQAAGSTLTLGGGVTLTLTGASTVSNLTVRGNAVVVNDATTTQSGGSVTLNTAVPTAVTELFNEATWQITDNSGIAISDDTVSLFNDSISFIDNADFLLKSGGTGTSTIAPTVTNTGEIVAGSGTFDFQQAVTGTGTDLISGASTLEFDATVAGSQVVEFSGSSGILDLTAPQSFAATISGFNEGAPGGTNDAIHLLGNWSETGFSENSGNTQATLTLSNGTTSASLIFAGVYNQSQFTLSQSGGVLTTIV